MRVLYQQCPSRPLPRSVAGDFDLISTHPAFNTWIEAVESSILILQGPHGCGKTVLSHLAYNYLQRNNNTNHLVSYFSFDKQDKRFATEKSFLVSVIRQILFDVPSVFRQTHEAYKLMTKNARWIDDDIWTFFRSILRSLKVDTLYCVLNAIDDCRVYLNQALVTKLSTLTGFCNQTIKLICTSTTDQKADLTIELEVLLKDEIKSFAKRTASGLLREMPILESVRDDVHSRFAKCEDYLQIGFLQEKLRNASCFSTPHALRNQMQDQEYDLKRVIITTLSQQKASWQRVALSWLVHAARPLTTDELAIAVGMETFRTTLSDIDDFIPRDIFGDLRMIFGPLVKIRNGAIRFVNPLVYEILAHEGPNIVASDGRPLITGHWQIAESCINYILAQEVVERAHSMPYNVGRSTTLERALSLVDYAISYWPLHYRQVSEDQRQPKSILNTLKNQKFRATWSALLTERRNPLVQENLREAKPIHLATRFGFCDVVDRFLHSRSNEELGLNDHALGLKIACEWGILPIVQNWLACNVVDCSGVMIALEKPCAKGLHQVVELLIDQLKMKSTENLIFPSVLLARAAQGGHFLTLKLLLRAGADANAIYQKSTPLHLAAAEGHRKSVDLLLKSDANVNEMDSNESKPLHLACSHGYPFVVRRILERKEAKDEPNRDGDFALHLAAGNGDIISVKELLKAGATRPALSDKGSSIDVRDRRSRTALHLAAENARAHIAKLLLDEGAQVDVPDDEGQTPLHHASELKDQIIARILLEKGADPNTVCRSTSTPLIRAAFSGNLSLVRYMLELKADLTIQDRSGWAPIHHASSEGYTDIVRLLIEYRADINSRTNDGSSPLIIAAGKGHEDVITLLIENSCDIGAQNEAGKTALHDAAKFGHERVAALLLDNGISKGSTDNKQRSPLHYAVTANTSSVARLLMGRGVDVNLSDRYSDKPIALAIRSGKTNVIRDLLDFHADPRSVNSDMGTPLQEAAFDGNIEALKILLEKAKVGVNDRSADGRTALHSCWTSVNAASWLLENGADRDAASKDGTTVLMAITRDGETDVFNLLVESGANIYSADAEGRTALDIACRLGKVKIVRKLLEKGANPNSIDVEGNTALNVAAEQGATTVVETLLDAGASINATDRYHRTALQYASSEKRVDTAGLLIQRGASIDLQDAEGDTALLLAANAGTVEITQMLLAAGARLEAANKLGMRPLLAAVKRGFKDVVSLLLERGANVGVKNTILESGLHLAAANKNKEILELVLSSEPDLLCEDDQGRLAVSYAAQQGHEEHVRMLIEAGSPWENVDDQGRTLIHHAVPHFKVVELANLISNVLKVRGSRPKKLKLRDHDGWTPLHWACKGGDARVVGLLLTAGADPDEACNRGWTPKLIAAFHGRKDLMPYWRKKEKAEQSPTESDIGRRRYSAVLESPVSSTRTNSFPVSPEAVSIEIGVRHTASICDSCSTVSYSLFLLHSSLSSPIQLLLDVGSHCRSPTRQDIFGIRFHCLTCEHSQGKFPSDINFCFKCAWSRDKSVFSDHVHEKQGSGYVEGPDPSSYWDGREHDSDGNEEDSSSGSD